MHGLRMGHATRGWFTQLSSLAKATIVLIAIAIVLRGAQLVLNLVAPCILHSGVSVFSGLGGNTGRTLCADGTMVISNPLRWHEVSQQ